MSQYIYYINGKFIKSSDAKVAFNDGGFQRGNAIFESIRFKNGHLFHVESHIKRLRDGINYLEFQVNETDEELIKLMFETIHQNNLETGVVNLMISSNFDINNPLNSKILNLHHPQ